MTNLKLIRVSNALGQCLNEKLDRYAALAHGGPKPPPIRTPFPSLSTSNWETVKSGIAAHVPLGERLALARFYDLAIDAREVTAMQRNAFLGLIAFDDKTTLKADESRRLLELIPPTRLLSATRSRYNHDLFQFGAAAGVHESDVKAVPQVGCDDAAMGPPWGGSGTREGLFEPGRRRVSSAA